MRVTSMLAEFIGKSRFEDCPAAAVDAAVWDAIGKLLGVATDATIVTAFAFQVASVCAANAAA